MTDCTPIFNSRLSYLDGLRWLIIVLCSEFLHRPTFASGDAPAEVTPPYLCVHRHLSGETSMASGQVLTDGSLLIHAGDNLTLACCGQLPLEWHADIIPQLDTADPFLVVSNSNTSTSGGYKYYSTFTYRDVAYDHTGRYWCRYKHHKALNDSVYVYSYSPTQLIAPTLAEVNHKLTMVKVRSPGTLVPCRATHPSVSLSLMKVKSQGPRDVEMGADVIYDPQRGFLLLYPSRFYSGMFYCMAQYTGQKEHKQVLLRYLTNGGAPWPELVANKNQLLKGEHLTLKCTVKVDRGLSVTVKFANTWTRSGDEITEINNTDTRVSKNGYMYDEISTQIDIFDVNKLDSGLYRCVVTVANGNTVSREKEIRVYDTAFATLTPVEDLVVATVGDDHTELRVRVFAVADGPVTYKWSKDGQEIRSGNSIYRLRQADGRGYVSLVIAQVTMAEAGVYSLTAENPNVTLNSVDIELRVKERDSWFWFKFSPLQPVEGDTVVLQCTASRWTYETVKITAITGKPHPVNAVKIDRQSCSINVTLTNVKVTDAGTYVCTARHPNGSSVSINLTVTVQGAVYPFFIKPVQSEVFAMEGSTVALECPVGGQPPPVTQWLRDGLVVSADNLSDVISIDQSNRLTILSANVSTMGLYSCIAKSRLGYVMANISVVLNDSREPRAEHWIVTAQSGLVIAVVLALVAVSAALVVFVLRRRRLKHTRSPNGITLSPSGRATKNDYVADFSSK